MAFGGVATGSINALLQLRANKMATILGLIPEVFARAIMMGMRIFAAAVFEASSVKKIVTSISIIKTKTILIPSVLEDMKFAKVVASPDLKRMEPRDKPEPNNKRLGQSIELIWAASKIFFSLYSGRIKRMEARKTPTTEAFKLLFKNFEKFDPSLANKAAILGVIQIKTVAKNIVITCFCSLENSLKLGRNFCFF